MFKIHTRESTPSTLHPTVSSSSQSNSFVTKYFEHDAANDSEATAADDDIYSTFFQNEKYVTYPMKYKVTLTLSQKETDLISSSWKFLLADSKSSQKTLNEKKFTSAAFSSSLFCHQFYDNLLDAKPDLAELFPNIRHQAVSFAGIMNVTINSLSDLSQLNHVLEHLGRIHSRILGIEAPFFELMGDALIKTIQDRYTNAMTDFSIELEDCWIKLYCFLANSILQSGIDPVFNFEKQPQPPPQTHSHLSKFSPTTQRLRNPSQASNVSGTDHESLFDAKSNRTSIAWTRQSSISGVSSPTKPINNTISNSQSATKSTDNTAGFSNTKKAIKSMTNSSKSNASGKNKLSSRLRRSKDSNDDGTCVVM